MPQITLKLRPTKPRTKALVLDPITKKPLKKGEMKPKNTYWMARIAEGDVAILENDKVAKAAKVAKVAEAAKEEKV